MMSEIPSRELLNRVQRFAVLKRVAAACPFIALAFLGLYAAGLWEHRMLMAALATFAAGGALYLVSMASPCPRCGRYFHRMPKKISHLLRSAARCRHCQFSAPLPPRSRSRPASSLNIEPSRIACLDGIRALAAAMVMLFHFIGKHGEPHFVQQAAVIGQTGVDLFFVLSGFLITRILFLTKESPHYFRSFYLRRSLRIFPLYFGFLVLFFFILPFLFGESIPPFREECWAWFYLENIPLTFPGFADHGPGHFWSLAVEEHFYLVWPLLVFLIPRRHFGWALAAMLLIALGTRILFLRQGLPVFYFTLTRMDALGFGALLAWLFSLTGFNGRWLFRVLCPTLGLALLISFTLLSGSRYDWLQTVKLSLIPAFYFSFLGFCLADPWAAPLRNLFSLRWLGWLGSISYGLYVFHPTCFDLVRRWGWPASFAVDFLLSFGLTIGLAYLSFRFFEAPILRLKARFPYERAFATS